MEDGAGDGIQTPAVTTVNASPSPADQSAQPGNASSRSPSAPVHASGSPSPDLAVSLERPQAIVTDEDAIPASGARDGQTQPQEQEQTGDRNVEQNVVMSSATSGNVEENGVTGASDVQMRDV